MGIVLKMKDDNGKRRVKIVAQPGSANNEKSLSFLDALQQVRYLHVSPLVT